MEGPFHQGEKEAHRITGENFMAQMNSQIFSEYINPNAIKFIENQKFIIVSTQDRSKNIWCDVIICSEGAIKVRSQKTFQIDVDLVLNNQDFILENLKQNPSAGTLFIDLLSRKRYRINGHVTIDKNKLIIQVEQAYLNCPKYIQRRDIQRFIQKENLETLSEGDVLSEKVKSVIINADTFFVGSSDGCGNHDASHRGGFPGFVQIVDEKCLVIPDYKGNSLYNTLGNFIVHPGAGLLFVDFENHRSLQLTGNVKIVWHSETDVPVTGGTNRFWKFETVKWILKENLNCLDAEFIDFSPFNP